MARCCGGIPNIKIIGDGAVKVEGIGTVADPIVISSDIEIESGVSSQFEVTVDGEGTVDDPYEFVVSYANTATISALPDVSDTPPTAGQALIWNDSLDMYVPNPVPTAPPGLINTDDSLLGDGSAPNPLVVSVDPDGGLAITPAGLGIDGTSASEQVRRFTNAADRTTNYPSPDLNALSSLDNKPGVIDYWNGSAWMSVAGGETIQSDGSVIHQFSGPYVNGTPTRRIVRTIETVSDALGRTIPFSNAELVGMAGILDINVTPLAHPSMGFSDYWWPFVVQTTIPLSAGLSLLHITGPSTKLASRPVKYVIAMTVY